jgi:hypothetical protein
MQPTQFAQIRAAGAQKAAAVPAVVPAAVVPAAGAPAAALVGKKTLRPAGRIDRQEKFLSPADRLRSEIATGAERVMQGAGFSAPYSDPKYLLERSSPYRRTQAGVTSSP